MDAVFLDNLALRPRQKVSTADASRIVRPRYFSDELDARRVVVRRPPGIAHNQRFCS
jgi:hypothetical protein